MNNDISTPDTNFAEDYDLISGLKDSFKNDYLTSERDRKEIDFSIDEEILQKIG